MNADLEEQLKEMGPDYQAVVARLRSARTVEPCIAGQRSEVRGRTAVWLVAASLLLALGLTTVFLAVQPSTLNPQSSTPFGAREYRLSPAEMIATQQPDGSWQNDFLTRRNAEVLAKCEGAAAHIACKKALRNLRARGVMGRVD